MTDTTTPVATVSLIIASKVKAAVKTAGMRSNQEFLDALSGKVQLLIEAAAAKAKEAKRATLKPEDLA